MQLLQQNPDNSHVFSRGKLVVVESLENTNIDAGTKAHAPCTSCVSIFILLIENMHQKRLQDHQSPRKKNVFLTNIVSVTVLCVYEPSGPCNSQLGP